MFACSDMGGASGRLRNSLVRVSDPNLAFGISDMKTNAASERLKVTCRLPHG